jgi:hypothetical protein
MIYVIRTVGLEKGFLKVGYTKNNCAKQRLYKIQTGCPHRLEIIKFFEGSEKDEADLHEKLKDFHSYGEWFLDNEETRKMLKITRETIFKARATIGKTSSSSQVRIEINRHFECIHGKRNPEAVPLDEFCAENDFCESAVRSSASNYFISTTTGGFLASAIKRVRCKHEDMNKEQAFIVPSHIIGRTGSSFNTWSLVKSDGYKKNESMMKQVIVALAST